MYIYIYSNPCIYIFIYTWIGIAVLYNMGKKYCTVEWEERRSNCSAMHWVAEATVTAFDATALDVNHPKIHMLIVSCAH